MEEHVSKRRRIDPGLASGRGSASTSDAFALECDELIRESQVDYDALTGVEELLRRLKSCMEAIEPRASQPIHEAATKLEKEFKIAVPFPDPKPSADSPYKVSLATPSQFNVVGSYVSKTMVRSQHAPAVDMIAVMPSGMFQEKDYLDCRYFYKRAFFVAVLAGSLRKEVGPKALRFGQLNGNPLLPILVVDVEASHQEESENGKNGKEGSAGNAVTGFNINIIPCAEEALFQKAKLAANKSYIRRTSAATMEKKSLPTPFYNNALKAEGSYVAYLRLLRTANKDCPSFADACILGRIWLIQRGLGGSIAKGGFGNHEWAVLLSVLLQHGGKKGQGALSKSWSATQLFKAVVQFLATTDFSKKPCVLGPRPDDVAAITESGPVLYDAGRQLNITYKMSTSSAALLMHFAKRTQAVLRDDFIDHFTPTFILKVNTDLQMFDLVFTISVAEMQDDSNRADAQPVAWEYAHKAQGLLKKALGDRAKLVHTEIPEATSWQLNGKHDARGPVSVHVGVMLDADNASRRMDHGPSVEDAEKAKRFQQFWGEKAELRRFKDGSILESLDWGQGTSFEICVNIVRYILQRHLNVGDGNGALDVHGTSFRSILPLQSTDVAAFSAVRQAFEKLEQHVRGLEDLPLHIRQIEPTSAALRYATVRLPAHTAPHEAVISFEASGKWPDSLPAIQQTKLALLLRIADLLEATRSDVKAYVGLDDPASSLGNVAFLDVRYDDSIPFRLRISSDLEQIILEQRTKAKALPQYARTESVQQLGVYRYKNAILPLHTQTITTFCTRFPALSPTIRLLKHWFDAHKLACHFTEEFIELLAVRTFLYPYPWDVPASGTTGFLRSIAWLARWDWRAEPLIIDHTGEMTSATRLSVASRLQAWRKIDPSMNHTALVVATSHDASGTAYTPTGRPSKVVAARMTSLARSANEVVKREGLELDAKSLYTPSLKDYDILVRLTTKLFKSDMLVYSDEDPANDHAKHASSKFKNLNSRTIKTALPIVTAPVNVLLDQLSTAFEGPLLFFHGGEEDRTIGGIWNPLINKRALRNRMPGSYRPLPSSTTTSEKNGADVDPDVDEANEEMAELNKEAILAEIARIGGDLIERIDVRDR